MRDQINERMECEGSADKCRKVDKLEITREADLGAPRWAGRNCIGQEIAARR